MATNDEAFLDDVLSFIEGTTAPKPIGKITVGPDWDEPTILRPTTDTDVQEAGSE